MSNKQIDPVYLQEFLSAGMGVEISDPKHPESEHRLGFVGTVELASEDGVVVVDYENSCFEVALNEILSMEDYHAEADIPCLAKVADDRWDILLVTTSGEIIPQGIVHSQEMALNILKTLRQSEEPNNG